MSYEHFSDSLGPDAPKSERYEIILSALPAFFSEGVPLISGVQNLLSLMHEVMGNLWTGIYFTDKPLHDTPSLFLAFFQGSPACDTIGYGKGVCGGALKDKSAIIVEDVESYPGHIACSSLSRSEIVLPFFDKGGKVLGVLDIDSDKIGAYGDEDQVYLSKIIEWITPSLRSLWGVIAPKYTMNANL